MTDTSHKSGVPMARGLLAQIREIFEGDPGVRKVADDPVLSAELLLLFRMILADGQVSDSEMAVFRRICARSVRHRRGVASRASSNISTISATRPTARRRSEMFRELDVERRRTLARHMAEIAKADSQLAENEVRLLRRTLDLLGISPVDVVKPKG